MEDLTQSDLMARPIPVISRSELITDIPLTEVHSVMEAIKTDAGKKYADVAYVMGAAFYHVVSGSSVAPQAAEAIMSINDMSPEERHQLTPAYRPVSKDVSRRVVFGIESAGAATFTYSALRRIAAFGEGRTLEESNNAVLVLLDNAASSENAEIFGATADELRLQLDRLLIGSALFLGARYALTRRKQNKLVALVHTYLEACQEPVSQDPALWRRLRTSVPSLTKPIAGDDEDASGRAMRLNAEATQQWRATIVRADLPAAKETRPRERPKPEAAAQKPPDPAALAELTQAVQAHKLLLDGTPENPGLRLTNKAIHREGLDELWHTLVNGYHDTKHGVKLAAKSQEHALYTLSLLIRLRNDLRESPHHARAQLRELIAAERALEAQYDNGRRQLGTYKGGLEPLNPTVQILIQGMRANWREVSHVILQHDWPSADLGARQDFIEGIRQVFGLNALAESDWAWLELDTPENTGPDSVQN